MSSLRNAVLLLVVLPLASVSLHSQRARKTAQATIDTLETTSPFPTLGTLGGISVDRAGTIFMSNFGSTLWRVTPGGRVTILRNDFVNASGNTIAPDGRLIQCDFGANRVYAIDKVTGQRTLIVRLGLNGPVGVAVSKTGVAFIANCNAQTIRRSGPSTLNSSVYASGPSFNCPNGIVLGPGGDLFVTNFNDDNILRVAPGGVVSTFATLGTSGLGGGHLVLVDDDLYATKLGSQDLYRVSLSGSVNPVAGREAVPGLRDGSARYARLRFPNGIGADPTGRILYTNNLDGPRGGGQPGVLRIRRIILP